MGHYYPLEYAVINISMFANLVSSLLKRAIPKTEGPLFVSDITYPRQLQPYVAPGRLATHTKCKWQIDQEYSEYLGGVKKSL